MVGDSPLSMAVMGGHRETVEHLVEHKADVQAANVDQETALHKAVNEGAQKIVNFLCNAGASLSAKNREGLTPVQLADEKGDNAIIDILAKCLANPNQVAPEGSFGYKKWQTRVTGEASAEQIDAQAANPQDSGPTTGAAKGPAQEAGAKSEKSSDDLGEWGKAQSTGLGGTRKDNMQPFKWDETIPKLADRKSLHMLVD
eukprot:CAMPEP_0184296450 /NCGR_PEP_ID=MMETSP1049-20130417/7430_1 /TAXON_ID=77928 /ORGANISM="Proteomonas sulcata, Strain CCMP704" /LENGTH=199 /DNA_ID=CAMNT_0026605703 /DNA_START=189 /DNA_END=788 /DNA_ORIENTATION=+